MTDRPILFSGPMVRALLDGRKTQTRRVIKPQPASVDDKMDALFSFRVRDRLWVRETWTARMTHGWTIADARSRMFSEQILYRADGDSSIDGWWPSIHMPREFSRLTLIVTAVRVQRLQDISEADAQAEGIGAFELAFAFDRRRDPVTHKSPGNVRFADAFADLWDSLNAARGFSWDANPWVVALTFTVHPQNIDQMEDAA